jgi:hypothetical protein
VSRTSVYLLSFPCGAGHGTNIFGMDSSMKFLLPRQPQTTCLGVPIVVCNSLCGGVAKNVLEDHKRQNLMAYLYKLTTVTACVKNINNVL